jgi:hypothetical protein
VLQHRRRAVKPMTASEPNPEKGQESGGTVPKLPAVRGPRPDGCACDCPWHVDGSACFACYAAGFQWRNPHVETQPLGSEVAA